MVGGIEEVVRAYEGDDAARHVREVLEETRRGSGQVSGQQEHSA
jgi:ABC-2 type transport system ATP-binding protein